MKILIAERLSQHKYKTPEGYLICQDAILARTGKQTYTRSEIYGSNCDKPDEIIEIDRTVDEVFSEATLASFENKPLTIQHPDEDVTVNNYKTYAVGFVRDVHRDKIDGKDVMLATLVITDDAAIADVENGRLLELSCGYDCTITNDEHPRQIDIRGNHVALCECGRAGIARIVDSSTDVEHQSKFSSSEKKQLYKKYVDWRKKHGKPAPSKEWDEYEDEDYDMWESMVNDSIEDADDWAKYDVVPSDADDLIAEAKKFGISTDRLDKSPRSTILTFHGPEDKLRKFLRHVDFEDSVKDSEYDVAKRAFEGLVTSFGMSNPKKIIAEAKSMMREHKNDANWKKAYNEFMGVEYNKSNKWKDSGIDDKEAYQSSIALGRAKRNIEHILNDYGVSFTSSNTTNRFVEALTYKCDVRAVEIRDVEYCLTDVAHYCDLINYFYEVLFRSKTTINFEIGRYLTNRSERI